MKVGDRVGPYRLERQLWWDGPSGGFLGRHEPSGTEVVVQPVPAEARRAGFDGRSLRRFQERAGFPPWTKKVLEVLPHRPGAPAPTSAGEDAFRDGEVIVLEALRTERLERLILEREGPAPSPSSPPFPLDLPGLLHIAIGTCSSAADLFDAGGFAFLDAARMEVTSGGRLLLGHILWEREAASPGAAAPGAIPLGEGSPPEFLRTGALTFPHMVFSLGVVLFRLICGRGPEAPEEGETLAARLERLAGGRDPGAPGVPDLRRIRPGVHPALADLAQDLTRWDPELRPQDGPALRARIDAAVSELGVEAAPPSIEANHIGP